MNEWGDAPVQALKKKWGKEGLMAKKIEICVLCAWRATCQKRFSISGKDMRCPDFVKDITVEERTEEPEKKGGER